MMKRRSIRSPEEAALHAEMALLFDSAFVSEQREAEEGVRQDISLEEYLENHRLWHYSPHPLFDSASYLRENPDIAQANINPLAHYVKHGGREGREGHPLFDSRFYRNTYLMGEARVHPLIDYLVIGATQGRLPYPGFDYDLYRSITSTTIPNERVLSDFSRHYFEPSRQKFAAELVSRVLNRNPRASTSIPLPPATPMQESVLCDVVIPVKDSIHWVAYALESTRPALNAGTVAEVLLVDDGSSPDSLAILKNVIEKFADSRARLVINEGAHGFAAACNLGVKSGRSPLVLFLNSDCLLAPNSIAKMKSAFLANPDIGMVCAPSNNAANVSVRMPEGFSFIRMGSVMEELATSLSNRYPEICTVVGHCLMVSRRCYQAVDGMDEGWGLGYGEESDFHLRARARGFLGVLAADTYVYHFGGGTFRHVEKRDLLQSVNHKRFIELWGESFSSFYRTVAPASPISRFNARAPFAHDEATCDVLFVLPGLTKGVGGVQVVIDLCNFLITKGVDARVVILGLYDQTLLAAYTEPLFFNPYHSPDDTHFVQELNVRPRVVVATLFATAPAAYRFAKKHNAELVNFVQGYESYFADGVFYEQVRDSYHLASRCIATSRWLTEGVKRHAPNIPVEQLPLGVDRYQFFPLTHWDSGDHQRRVRVGMVIRAAADKGQFVLREICDMLLALRRDVSLTVFVPQHYEFSSPWIGDDATRVIRIPVDRVVIAKELQEIDIFVDASLHEGYGLFPLEAMACGACVVASDSGGITQFLANERNGLVIDQVNKPERYIAAIKRLLDDRGFFLNLRKCALETACDYDEKVLFSRYKEFLCP